MRNSMRGLQFVLWRVDAYAIQQREAALREKLPAIVYRLKSESEAAKQLAGRQRVPKLICLQPGERWG